MEQEIEVKGLVVDNMNTMMPESINTARPVQRRGPRGRRRGSIGRGEGTSSSRGRRGSSVERLVTTTAG